MPEGTPAAESAAGGEVSALARNSLGAISRAGGEAILATLVSLAIMAALYPAMFVEHDIRFTGTHDIELPFEAAFQQAKYFIGSGIQLWDRFDQVNIALPTLSTGFYTFVALAEGWLFSLIYPLSDRPGEALQVFHVWAYFSIVTLVRTVGGLALLSLYTRRFATRFVSLLVLNTLLAGTTYCGILVAFLYSLTPAILYYAVALSREKTLAALLALALAMLFAVANSPLIGLGYFYMAIHFFLIAIVVTMLSDATRRRRASSPAATGSRSIARSRTICLAAILAVSLAVIAVTDVQLLSTAQHSFALTGTGLGGSSGRFGAMLHPLDYFATGDRGPGVGDFLWFTLNFETNEWSGGWTFLGAAVLALSVLGVVYARTREKWYFAAAILLDMMAQYPRDLFSLASPAHYLNAFTNPFSFLLRGMTMTIPQLPYLLLPFVAMGIEALLRRGEAEAALPGWGRDLCALGALGGLVVYAALVLPATPSLVAVGILLAFAALILLTRFGLVAWRPRLRTASIAAIGLALCADWAGYGVFLANIPNTSDPIVPRRFTGLETTEPVVIDYQNPGILPFPLHVRAPLQRDAEKTPIDEAKFAKANSDQTIAYAKGARTGTYFVRQMLFAAVFHVIFVAREFQPLYIYEQRQIQYRNAPTDEALQAIFQHDDRYVFHADAALDADRFKLADLVAAGADSHVIAIRPTGRASTAGLTADAIPASGAPAPLEAPPPLRFTFAARDAAIRDRGNFRELSFPLPPGFPRWRATEIFTRDHDGIRASIGVRPLEPEQGHLIRSFTFDVNNVATGRLVVALPAEFDPDAAILLEVDQDPLVRDVWLNTDDAFGIDYQAPAAGWMVVRNPYEGGWLARVNGKPAPIFIADDTSMAVAVAPGLNKVEFAYRLGGKAAALRYLLVAELWVLVVLQFLLLGDLLRGASLPRRPGP